MIAEPKQQPHNQDRNKRERRRDEKALDEALKNTFPASDPVSVEQPVLPHLVCSGGAGSGLVIVKQKSPGRVCPIWPRALMRYAEDTSSGGIIIAGGLTEGGLHEPKVDCCRPLRR